VRKPVIDMKEDIRRTDPLTREEFTAGRVNQRFVIPANRIKFHNESASDLRKDRAFLDKHVHRNHLICRQIYVEGSDNVFDNMWLLGKGLRNDATNHQVAYQGIIRNCIYEYVLIPIENKTKIIKLKLKK
jgi:hypothetical protein